MELFKLFLVITLPFVTARFSEGSGNEIDSSSIVSGAEVSGEILDINDGSDMAEANVITTSDNGDDDNDDYDMKPDEAKHDMNETEIKDIGTTHLKGYPDSQIKTIVKKLRDLYKDEPLTNRVIKRLDNFQWNWLDVKDSYKHVIVYALGNISTNIDSFAKTKSKPLEAIKSLMVITKCVWELIEVGKNTALGSQLPSYLLSLFARGKETVPLMELLEQSIRPYVFSFPHNAGLMKRATNILNELDKARTYLYRIAIIAKPLDLLQIMTNFITIKFGYEEDLLKIKHQIDSLFKNNKLSTVRECLLLVEIYNAISSLCELVLTQLYDWVPAGYNYKREIGDIQRGFVIKNATNVMSNLYINGPGSSNLYASKILPYYNPKWYTISETYVANSLQLKHIYDNQITEGLYCIRTFYGQDLVWSRSANTVFLINGKPYTTLNRLNYKHCYWRFIPHGNDCYTIVNRYGCAQNNKFCGYLLSYDSPAGHNQLLTVEQGDPNLWQIKKHKSLDRMKILNKWGCDRDVTPCDYEIRTKDQTVRGTTIKDLGQLFKQNSLYLWELHKP